MNYKETLEANLKLLTTVNEDYRETIKAFQEGTTQHLETIWNQKEDINRLTNNWEHWERMANRCLIDYRSLRKDHDTLIDTNQRLKRKEKTWWLLLGICLTSGAASLLYIIGF